MRNARYQFLKLLVYGSVSTLAFASCGIRNKEVSKKLSSVSNYEALDVRHDQVKLVTYNYGDMLAGTFMPDTSGTDSTEFESSGIKGKIKTTKTPKGTRIDYNIQAKAVARSELTATSDHKQEVKKQEAKTEENQSNTKTNSLSGWVWFALAAIVIGVILVVIQKVYKKIRNAGT